MRPFDPQYRPDPKKITVKGGVFFNPWVNIAACTVATIGLALATWWVTTQYLDVSGSAPYPDQGLDEAGTLIGAVVLGLATIVLFVCTIFTIRWWSRRIRRDHQHRDQT